MIEGTRRTTALLLCALWGCTTQPSTPHADSGEFDRAVLLATKRLDSTVPDASKYKLLAARRHVIEGRTTWLITFKLVALLPADPATGRFGAGGEVFVKVDLLTETTTVTYGE